MSVVKRKLKAGIRYAYDKQVRGQRLWSPYIYTKRSAAVEAEAKAAAIYAETGQVLMIPPTGASDSESVGNLFFRWVDWLKIHRAPRHAYNMLSLMTRALAQAPHLADIPAADLTVDQVEEWGEIWGADLLDRGKSRKTVNDWLRYAQTAFNAPWGRRRAIREYSFNPFAHVDRYAVERLAKYVPWPAEVAANSAAAECMNEEPEARLHIEIMSRTAARVGEARSMAWADARIDAPPYSVVLYTQKTADGSREPRRLAIDGELAERFRIWREKQRALAKKDKPKYVHQQNGEPEPRGETWSLKAQRRACTAAGVDYFPPGCYRHYRAHRWAQEGVALTTIRDRLGHTKVSTTDNYLRSLAGI